MKCLTFVLTSPWKRRFTDTSLEPLLAFEYGWGNGYVAIPPNHPGWGKDWETTSPYLDVHGGVTLCGKFHEPWRKIEGEVIPEEITKDWWIVGFDTGHWGDNEHDQNEAFVRNETEHLLRQIEELSMGTINAPPSLE